MSSSEGGGGITGWTDLSLPDWLTDLRRFAGELIRFARAPLRYLRARIIPLLLGGFFGFVFELAEAVARPFGLIINSLAAVNAGITEATKGVTNSIELTLDLIVGVFFSLTSPLGPLQPFAVGAVAILVGYGVIVVSIRLARALADAIPILSGVETFLFG